MDEDQPPELYPVDYLLKPIHEERLKDTITKVLAVEASVLSTRAQEETLEAKKSLGVNDQVFVKDITLGNPLS